MPNRIREAVVFGSGFGLYGHAIALHELGLRLYLPERYRSVIESRSDLAVLAHHQFFDDHKTLIPPDAQPDALCFCQRPQDNVSKLKETLRMGFAGTMVVEKPFAPTSAESLEVYNQYISPWLSRSETCQIVTPFLFLYLDWQRLICRALADGKRVKVQWNQRPPSDSALWKSTPAQGGGVLAFYGIHLIALALAMQTDEPHGSIWEVDQSERHFRVEGSNLSAEINLADKANFRVQQDQNEIFHAPSPFGEAPKPGSRDPRVPALKEHYRRAFSLETRKQSAEQLLSVLEFWQSHQNV